MLLESAMSPSKDPDRLDQLSDDVGSSSRAVTNLLLPLRENHCPGRKEASLAQDLVYELKFETTGEVGRLRSLLLEEEAMCPLSHRLMINCFSVLDWLNLQLGLQVWPGFACFSTLHHWPVTYLFKLFFEHRVSEEQVLDELLVD
ncbi:hypothetical protein Tco_0452091 [Tanacetum coccineum]